MKARLGVNIDHVATLRQARGEFYPSVVEAAKTVLEHGADQITIHLREDRRHIQDTDVEAIKLVTEKYGRPLNLELGVDPEIMDIAVATSPEWLCLVPEKRMERTTEGGLDLNNPDQFQRIQKACDFFKSKLPKTKISLFLEADLMILEGATKMNIDAVEIHTGDYAKAHLNGEDIASYMEKFDKACAFLKKHGISHHAGHGLTDISTAPLVERAMFLEYNIGHWIIAQSLFEGLGPVVSKLKNIIVSTDVT